MHVMIMGPVAPADLVGYLADVPADEMGRNHGAPVGALCRGLLDAGHDLTIVTHERGRPGLHLTGPRVNFLRVQSRSSPRRQILDFFAIERRDMYRLASSVNPDVVHAHWTYEWHRAAIGLGVPLIVTIHDAPWTIVRHNLGLYWVLRALNSLLNRILTPSNTTFVAVSDYVRRRWSRQHFWRRAVEVIPNVVDVGNQLPNSTNGEPYLVELADASRRKRGKLLTDKYCASDIEWPLEMVGAGLTPNAHSIGDPNRLAERGVRLRGPLPRAEALARLAGAAVHVHASAEESFGMTVIESLILGVPVVVDTNSGGPVENIRKYRTGVAVDFKAVSSQQFSDCIRAAAAQRASVAEIAESISQEHSEATIAARYVKIYEGSMGRPVDFGGSHGI